MSALKKTALDQLEEEIVKNVWHGKVVDTHGVLVSNIRHIEALKECEKTLSSGERNLSEGISLEFVSEHIKTAVNYLDAITGRNIDNDLLNTIFSEFCIGK